VTTSTLMLGLVRQERMQDWPQERIGRVLGRRDPHAPPGLVLHLGQGSELDLDLRELGTDDVQRTLARLGREDTARGSVSSRIPSCSSRSVMARLRADWGTPRRAAARAKLSCDDTFATDRRSVRFSRAIDGPRCAHP
jgi:hypothetical protein